MEQVINFIFTAWANVEQWITVLLFAFGLIGVVAEVAAYTFAPGVATGKILTLFRFIYGITRLLRKVNEFLEKSTFTQGGFGKQIDKEAYEKYLEKRIEEIKAPLGHSDKSEQP